MKDEEIIKKAVKDKYGKDSKWFLMSNQIKRTIKEAIKLARQDERKKIYRRVFDMVLAEKPIKDILEWLNQEANGGERGAQVSPCGDGDASARGGGDDTFSVEEKAPQGSGSPANTKEVSEK